nr:hypothetical protein [Neorhizobium tomejilense]
MLDDATMGAVTGVPHPMLGEAPVACIVLMGVVAFDQDALLKHCKDRLSAYKVPDRVDVATEMLVRVAEKSCRTNVATACGGVGVNRRREDA